MLAVALAAGSVLVCAAQAQVINFDEFTKTTPGPDKTGQDNYSTISSGGYLFSNECEVPDACLGVWDTDSPWQLDPGGAAVFNNYGFTTTTMAREDGGMFDLRSVDLADVYNQGTISTVAFTFHYLSGGSSSVEVELDGLPGAQTVQFNQRRLSHVSWQTVATSSNGWSQFDNVNVTPLRPTVSTKR